MEVYYVIWERHYDAGDFASDVLHVFSSSDKAREFLRKVLLSDYVDHPLAGSNVEAFVDKHWTNEFKDTWEYGDVSYTDYYGVYATELD